MNVFETTEKRIDYLDEGFNLVKNHGPVGKLYQGLGDGEC